MTNRQITNPQKLFCFENCSGFQRANESAAQLDPEGGGSRVTLYHSSHKIQPESFQMTHTLITKLSLRGSHLLQLGI